MFLKVHLAATLNGRDNKLIRLSQITDFAAASKADVECSNTEVG
jgi:hypothetical protein